MGVKGEPVEPDTTDEEATWTTGQVADYLKPWGFNRKLISAMINSGELPGTRRHPGAWARVPVAVVLKYAASLPKPTGQVQRRPRARIGRGDDV